MRLGRTTEKETVKEPCILPLVRLFVKQLANQNKAEGWGSRGGDGRKPNIDLDTARFNISFAFLAV